MQNQVVKLLIYDLFFFKEAFLGVFLLLCRQKKRLRNGYTTQ